MDMESRSHALISGAILVFTQSGYRSTQYGRWWQRVVEQNSIHRYV